MISSGEAAANWLLMLVSALSVPFCSPFYLPVLQVSRGLAPVIPFNFPSKHNHCSTSKETLCLRPSSSSSSHLYLSSPPKTVGVVGTGYVSILAAKLAALSGYKAWVLHPPGEEETVVQLIDNNGIPDDLSLVASTDTVLLSGKLPETEALIIATDSPDAPMDPSVISYLAENAQNLKRIVLMSRNLNKQGNEGFFVKASKISANNEVWCADNDIVAKYQKLESLVKELCKSSSSDMSWVIVRAGTLKGGACGDVDSTEYYPQYLTNEFYTMTKKDIVTWNLLFDCRIRGVQLYKGDTMPGPGVKAAFTATSPDDCEGDTSRASVAECMVRSLGRSDIENLDFGVGTIEDRETPSDEGWEKLFATVV